MSFHRVSFFMVLVVAAVVFLSCSLSLLSVRHSYIHSRTHLCMHGIHGIQRIQLQGPELTSSTALSAYRECPFRCVALKLCAVLKGYFLIAVAGT